MHASGKKCMHFRNSNKLCIEKCLKFSYKYIKHAIFSNLIEIAAIFCPNFIQVEIRKLFNRPCRKYILIEIFPCLIVTTFKNTGTGNRYHICVIIKSRNMLY